MHRKLGGGVVLERGEVEVERNQVGEVKRAKLRPEDVSLRLRFNSDASDLRDERGPPSRIDGIGEITHERTKWLKIMSRSISAVVWPAGLAALYFNPGMMASNQTIFSEGFFVGMKTNRG